MALKFLNKKGWHTGSLRNVENVWKAEQKHEAEQKKLEELRKQIQEERERSEFRLLQEQAGLVPRQERLDFLYDSGLAVGKGSSDAGGGGGAGFKALEEALPLSKPKTTGDASSSAPGALFEDKPHSANDAWRKLHSDPLLLIRQREQEALARVRNNPVQMALIRKSVEGKKQKEKAKSRDKNEKRDKGRLKKHLHDDSKPQNHEQSDSEHDIGRDDRKNEDHKGLDYERRNHRSRPEDDISRADRKNKDHKGVDYERREHRPRPDSDDESSQRDSGRRKRREKEYQNGGTNAFRDDYKSKHRRHSPEGNMRSKVRRHSPEGQVSLAVVENKGEHRRVGESSMMVKQQVSSQHRHRGPAPKLSEEERAARLREMQEDADLHEEQRWSRLKKADEKDACEAAQSSNSGGRNFLDAAHRSVYGAEKGGSSTIEESVRRRSHYSQGKYADEGNAFRR